MSSISITTGRRTFRATTFYLLLLIAALGLFLLITHVGGGLTAPTPEHPAAIGAAAVHASSKVLLHTLLALAAVIVAGRLLGIAFRYVHQPPVIGEVLAGILLGPSLLGWVAPEAQAYLLPKEVAPYLGLIAQIGVILYMFVVGLELDSDELRKRGHATVAISHASIIAPFLLGGVLALAIYPLLSTSDVPFTVFALFLGVSMSVTAFPVLARILTDRQMTQTHLGQVALACAAVDDVTAWCLLAFVVGVAKAEIGGALQVSVLTLGYIMFMFFVARPLLTRAVRRWDNAELGQGAVAIVMVGVLFSALATEFIGVHAIFGAFLFGAVIPYDSNLARNLCRRLEDLVTVLLLPAFFAFTGMRTQIGLVSGTENWLWCGVIIAVATLGKFGGSCLAARLSGLGWRDSSALGILMNTRGLMELIVLNIGLDLKVISDKLYAMLVIMALVTTMATTPVLQWLARGKSPKSDK
jgi:Kef-type K+ transport system membrane component KefB